MQLKKTSVVVSTGYNQPLTGPNVLGVVVRIEMNSFARKLGATIIFENGKFAEYLEEDIGEDALILQSKFNANQISHLNFITDEDITSFIKSPELAKLFENIRVELIKLENEPSETNQEKTED